MDFSSMRPSSWNGVGAIANVPAASWVSFIVILYPLFRHSGMVRQHQTRNLEIPGSMLRIAPE
jgi:hypothetical protein